MRVAKMYRCSVDLPSLKTLDLDRVSFHDMENLMRLISGCPVLENLTVSDVETRAGLTIGGYFKPLSKLIKANIHSLVVPLRAVSNVQFLIIYEIGKIIHDEKIKDFPVFGNLTELNLSWTFRDTHDWDEVVKMLYNCPKLQTLKIVKGIDSTTGEDWKYPYYVPECVSSHLTTCNIADFEAVNADVQFAKYILQNARLLQVLSIIHYPEPFEPQVMKDLFSCSRISPAFIRESQGKWLGGFAKCVGLCSVFVAELWGVLEGLRCVRRLGFSNVEVNIDSTLVVQVMKERRVTSSQGYALAKQIWKLLDSDWVIEISHTYREAN
ncbi:F-box/LRR-repeat protein [Trifolium medium]|uniref:F-box/LRR-repeat protein n=1 Tax=Trifolium medium TaxID=97028 RepID=A0A392M1J6_9FABA|nr:F-box/LRR-repeat protein [Trifolium medium]